MAGAVGQARSRRRTGRRGSTAPHCGSPWSAMPRLLMQIAGLNILTDPVWSRARLAAFLRRAEAGQRARHRLRRACRRSTSCCSATTTTTISTSPRWSACKQRTTRWSSRRSATTRIIRAAIPDVRISVHRLGRGVASAGRRRRPCRAGPSLVGARHARPPHGAVVRLRDRDAGRQYLFRRRYRLPRRHQLPAAGRESTAASGSPSCRSAPTSRAGSWKASTRTRTRRCEACCFATPPLPPAAIGARSSSPTSRSRSRAKGCSRRSTPTASPRERFRADAARRGLGRAGALVLLELICPIPRARLVI